MSKATSASTRRRHQRMCSRLLKFAAAMALMTAPALGVTVTWNVAGPTNTWNLTDANWTGGSPNANLYVNGDDAVFSSATGDTVTLSGVIAPLSTTVSATGGTYTFNGDAITNGALTKSNAGTLVLNNANTYNGVTAINGGVLRVTNAAALGSTVGATTVANGARLELSNNITVSGETITIIGAGGNNLGALNNLSGTNTWAGNVVIGDSAARIGASAGILNITGVIDDGVNNFALNVRNGDASGAVVVSNVSTYGGATNIIVGPLRLDGGNNRLPTGTTLNIGNVSNVATATFDLNGRSQTVAGLTSAGTTMDMTVTNTGGGASTLTVNNAIANAYTGTITGNTALTKGGAGTLTLGGNNANTYTGLTTISAGTLVLDKNASGVNALGGSVSVTGGILRWDESNQLADGATLTQSNGTVSFNGRSETFTNYTKSNGNTATGANAAINITGTLSISGGGQFDINSPSTFSANALNFTGGALTVGGGGGVLSVGAGGLSMTGSTMNLNAGTSMLNLGGNVTTVASGTEANIQRNGAGTNPVLNLLGGTRTFNIADGAALVDLDIDNVNIANGALTKTGTGVLRLTGTNTYAGNTIINGGALRITNPSALGTTAGSTTVNNLSAARLELAGGITVTGEALTISGGGNNFGALQSQSGDNTWDGSVLLGLNDTRIATAGVGNILRITGVIDDGANSFSLAVRHENAAGILELSGANTYGGATNIFNGVLRIAGADDRLPTGTSLNFGVPANGSGFNSTFDLNGFNQSVAGLTSTDSGTPDVITLTNSSLTASTLTVNNAGANNFAGVITGNLAITKGGAGALTLDNAINTYTGNTTVSQGTLALTGTASIDNSPVISIAAGATFDVSGTSSTFNLVAGQSLIGNGSIIGDVITDGGSLISPGFSIGTLAFATNVNSLDINGDLLIEVDPSAIGQKIDLITVAGLLDISGANLEFDFLSAPIDGTYVFASYGSLVGEFASITGLPSGYELRLSFNGQNQIALVSIPEPATMSLLALGSLALLRRRRMV